MKTLLRFWREHVQRYRWYFFFGILCLVATNTLTVAIPGFVEQAIDALDLGKGTDGALPWVYAILIAGVGVILVRTLSRTLFFNPGRTIEFRVKSAMFDHLLALPQLFFDRIPPGDIISRGTNDANSMRALIGFGSLQLFNVVFILILTIGRMLQMDAWLTLWCILPLMGAAVILRFAVLKMFALFGQLQAQIAKLSDGILEHYSGVSVLQAYDAVPGAMTRFDVDNERLLELGEGLLAIRAWLLPIVSVVGNLCVVIVLYLGGVRVIKDQMTLGQLAAFSVYVGILVSGVISLGWLFGAVQRGYVSLGRIFEIFDADDSRPPIEAALPKPAAAGHSLAVEDLSFTYPKADEPTLLEVSFTVESGETLGIFGLTGSGKSTLLDVLARVYDPPPGTVSVSGVDIVSVPVEDYWRSVAYVGQEAFLFSESIRANVAVASQSGVIDEERVLAAVTDAELMGDLEALPDGLDTQVGERGITLSGGQRQRTSLARAFYRDFNILLLDDVMSAVDHATEHKLIEAIYRRAANRTTVVVSHRISVLKRADRVLVLDEGRVVAQGRHEDLLEGDGPYARAWRLQQAAEKFEEADVAS